MSYCPNIWKLDDLTDYASRGEVQAGLPDGRWVPARTLGFQSLGRRIKATWLVWTGRADVVLWPGQ